MSFSRFIHGLFTVYSWFIHGLFTCYSRFFIRLWTIGETSSNNERTAVREPLDKTPPTIPAVHANISVRWRFIVSRLSELPPLQAETPLRGLLPFRLHSVSSLRFATFHCVWRQRYFSIMPTQSLPFCSVPC